MLRRAAAAFLLIFALAFVLSAVAAFAGEKELAQCTLDLQESRVKASIVAQTRDAIETQLAKALRANQELGQEYDKLALHIKDLNKKISDLEKAKADEPKVEKETMRPDFEKDLGAK